MSISGIDVSAYQGRPDWAAIAAAGFDFAAIKFTEGTNDTGQHPDYDWDSAASVGMARIAYHFCRPSANAAAAEAAYFLGAVTDKLGPGDGIWCDFEDDNASGPAGTEDYASWLLLWLRAVEAAVGFKPVIYSRAEYLRRHNCADSALLTAYGLAIAAYQSTQPADLAGWPFYAFWQFGAGAVPGVSGPCDLDLFNGTIEQLKAYGKPQAPAKPRLSEHDRYQLVSYAVNGSGVRDLQTWLSQFQD